jgi:hypothetical protein
VARPRFRSWRSGGSPLPGCAQLSAMRFGRRTLPPRSRSGSRHSRIPAVRNLPKPNSRSDATLPQAARSDRPQSSPPSGPVTVSIQASSGAQPRTASGSASQIRTRTETPQAATASKYLRLARTAAGLEPFTRHGLRHHHASVQLPSGVSPALVAERLGDTITTLLATYAHVIRSEEDRVRTVVDQALVGSAEDWLRTEAAGG